MPRRGLNGAQRACLNWGDTACDESIVEPLPSIESWWAIEPKSGGNGNYEGETESIVDTLVVIKFEEKGLCACVGEGSEFSLQLVVKVGGFGNYVNGVFFFAIGVGLTTWNFKFVSSVFLF